jgi:hypothetical protein
VRVRPSRLAARDLSPSESRIACSIRWRSTVWRSLVTEGAADGTHIATPSIEVFWIDGAVQSLDRRIAADRETSE